ncbi:uncharacterized protein ACWYII_000903 isoform 2-T2 [Salvelinus alpinus]
MYEEGKLPLLYSEEKTQVQGVGWHLVAQQASYQCNGHQHTNQPCYTLSWIFCFPYYQVKNMRERAPALEHQKDTCYLSHCYPYTNLWTHPRLCEERKLLLYFDLHGHIRKHNVFNYGCENPRPADRHPEILCFSTSGSNSLESDGPPPHLQAFNKVSVLYLFFDTEGGHEIEVRVTAASDGTVHEQQEAVDPRPDPQKTYILLVRASMGLP